jgi:hypothetical protein
VIFSGCHDQVELLILINSTIDKTQQDVDRAGALRLLWRDWRGIRIILPSYLRRLANKKRPVPKDRPAEFLGEDA